jgi:UPF0716 family protein affecting phage T7 exclusion
VFLNYAIEGYAKHSISIIVRGIFLVGSILLIVPGLTNDIIGIIFIAIGYWVDRLLLRLVKRIKKIE